MFFSIHQKKKEATSLTDPSLPKQFIPIFGPHHQDSPSWGITISPPPCRIQSAIITLLSSSHFLKPHPASSLKISPPTSLLDSCSALIQDMPFMATSTTTINPTSIWACLHNDGFPISPETWHWLKVHNSILVFINVRSGQGCALLPRQGLLGKWASSLIT